MQNKGLTLNSGLQEVLKKLRFINIVRMEIQGPFILFFIDVLNGYNGTIFAYGQTSSGKTHTMEVCFFLKFMVMI